MKKITHCDLCGSKDFKFLFANQDRIFAVDKKYNIYECKKCGLIFVNPQPTAKELSKHYPKQYYSLKGKEPRKLKVKLYQIFFSKSNFFLKLILSPLKLLLRSTKVVKDGKFLDVGCGSGEFLLLMKKFKMDCYGVEPSRIDKTFVKKHKLKIFNGTLKKAKYPKNYFDVITLSWVFEHLTNPSETLKELARILKPNGSLIISVPQSRSLMYKLFKTCWVSLDTPRHLFIYSPVTMKMYAYKANLKIKRIRYLPGSILANISYALNKFRKKPVYFSEKSFATNKLLMIFTIPLDFLLSFLKVGDAIEIELTKK